MTNYINKKIFSTSFNHRISIPTSNKLKNIFKKTMKKHGTILPISTDDDTLESPASESDTPSSHPNIYSVNSLNPYATKAYHKALKIKYMVEECSQYTSSLSFLTNKNNK